MSIKLSNAVKGCSLSALVLGMGLQSAHALEINVVNMVFNGDYNASGTINFENATGRFSSTDPFFAAHWTADVITVFTTPGTYTWSYSGPTNGHPTADDPTPLNDNLPIGTYSYTFTLAPGQVAAGTYFDWNGNFDIPVLTIFDCNNPDSGCVAAGPDANGGVIMQTPPFQGQAPAFNGLVASASVASPPPLRLANDVSVNAVGAATISWTPGLVGTVAAVTCQIDTPPATGTAIVAADCSSGSYTAPAVGYVSETFTYRVTTTTAPGSGVVVLGGNDLGTVTVSETSAPTANPDTVVTDVATAVVVDVLANDTAVSGATLNPASVTITTPATQGATSVNSATGAVTYTPNAGFCGADTFAYTVTDSQPVTSTPAAVTVNVNTTGAPCSPGGGVVIAPGSINPAGDGRVTLSELLSAGFPEDPGLTSTCVGGCFDFQVGGVTPGGTVTLVLPLSQPMPVAPKFRKYIGRSWGDFVEDTSNTIGSAASSGGACPTSGYAAGLAPGNDCIQITIEDGGPNDADGTANGTIVDPSGVGKRFIPAVDTTLGSTSGCTIGDPRVPLSRRFDWALLFGGLCGLWLWSRRKSRLDG